jgi:cytosine/adenosine deaminase-related metal-dependent hydrolase
MTVITSKHSAHYIGFGDDGPLSNDWLWTRSFERAHRFASRDEAEAFVAARLPGMQVWYLA